MDDINYDWETIGSPDKVYYDEDYDGGDDKGRDLLDSFDDDDEVKEINIRNPDVIYGENWE